ncbi:SusD/RagB family nutrient-binding outer membrane lipoprotein [Aequorivita lipolytica]|uniref:SusD/RagB family nutrient-binding outer membrane lipoprotein n=1 Tax=Aequorivita lipolytica TaxID=153267 RepID=A0A5C6YQP9_9FLAO|nr:SusD/RagB family nutrient-binding outer membrane lipoprotein [Aequorivita lipolytica]TXD69763.1 SusD/RagB family nutrient-binding outer membrane lipoprotein [Aequorivita lipolytica]SRX50428.1 hypothetical protein AEQU2_00901 [Aequorivita lipolytica]
MKKLILILTAAVFAASCSDSLEDLNQNIKDPTAVSGESLFASAEKQLADQITTPNVNLNNLRLWTQQWQETTYPDESNYDQATRPIPDNHWREMYRDVLRDLKEASINIAATDNDISNPLKPNKLAIIEILNVYAWSNLVETYGDVPYTEALDIDNLLPKYDDGLTVYKDLLVRLTAAINSMDTSKGSFTGDVEKVYAGDVASWKKFGNTLKLRMGIILADVDGGAAKAAVESAVASGVFTSNADDAGYNYTSPPNGNPLNNNLVLSNRNDYVGAKTMIDKMNELEDPRRGQFYTEINGEFVGGVIGDQTVYSDYSHVTPSILDGDYPGWLLQYAETEFLLAEAAARGYSVGGDAESHYIAGITASFDFWGADGIADYLAKPDVAYDSANWRESIGTQAWLALYNRTFAPWLSIRRLDFPILVEPLDPESGYPVRYPYPVSEINLNNSNYEEAASAIGGDVTENKLFWDVFDNTFGF